IDGMNCTPRLFTEKLSSRKLTVPVLETILGCFCGTTGRWAEDCLQCALNMSAMVLAALQGVVSPWFRFFSVCFAWRAVQQARNNRFEERLRWRSCLGGIGA
ncbi:hypothetical protein, partial [Paracidovorax sp. MALMAid1276]|uniref:hypothetical protein n=1 Tax=Paracidovorax sp. MALMAid1276 TaxID=3411631 RepID=UPI003B9DA58F